MIGWEYVLGLAVLPIGALLITYWVDRDMRKIAESAGMRASRGELHRRR